MAKTVFGMLHPRLAEILEEVDPQLAEVYRRLPASTDPMVVVALTERSERRVTNQEKQQGG